MGSFSGLGIGLSFVFGCILMGLVAELYYLLWWKKRIANSSSNEIHENLSFLFCWKKPTSFNSETSTQELTNPSRNQENDQDLELGSNKNNSNVSKDQFSEEGVEQELMRIHNLSGPPRFLFTIKEESREDLDSEDGKSRKGSRARSLSDLIFAADSTPNLTPISSPTLKPANNLLDSYNHHGINPLFESITEAEINRLRSSPPPKLKFLKDAEDKLFRKMIMEESGRKLGLKDDEKMGYCDFVSVIDVREKLHNQASQVLPLPSSPNRA